MDLSATSMEIENGTEKEEDKRQKQRKKIMGSRLEKVKSSEKGGKGWEKG